MKRFILVATILFVSPAFAEDAKKEGPKAPTCGVTAAECELKLTTIQSQAQTLMKQVQVYKQLLDEANDRLVAALAK